MRLHTSMLLRTAFLAAGLLERGVAQSSGLFQKYCSTQNTAGNYAAVDNQYQSNGACKTQCDAGSYAYAIVQGRDCWCSNLTPSTLVSTSQCSEHCPGYPDDLCGNTSGGLFGYIALSGAIAGTYVAQPVAAASPSSISTSSYSTSQSSSAPQLQSSPGTQNPQDPTTVVSFITLAPSSSSSSTSTSSTSTDTGDSSPTAAATSVQVVTVSGAVVYKTITSSPIPASAQDSNLQKSTQNSLSGGAIAGIVIGVLAGIAALLFGLFLLWRRRRSQDALIANEKNGRSPKRNISVLSRSGLLAKGGHEQIPEKEFDEPIHPGSSSQRHSMLFGAAATAEGVSPVSPLETTHSGDSRRHSKPMVYDQRLNPSALFATHDNGSRASMQDGADYSRPLGVTNPDPRSSFDSRFSRA